MNLGPTPHPLQGEEVVFQRTDSVGHRVRPQTRSAYSIVPRGLGIAVELADARTACPR